MKEGTVPGKARQPVNPVVEAKLASARIFTTGEIAKLLGVAPRTVSKWFDSGRLKGYRIPGSSDRRVQRENLIRFMNENGMPLGVFSDAADAVLVGVLDSWAESFAAAFGARTVVRLPGLMGAVAYAAERQPRAVVLDGSLGFASCREASATIRDSVPLCGVVCVVPDDLDATDPKFTRCFGASADPALAAAYLIGREEERGRQCSR